MTDLRDARTAGWLEDVLGTPFRFVGSLSFGVTSELTLVEADGGMFVLRRYTDPDALAGRPRLVEDEVQVLHAARAVLGALVPEPVAFDAAGTVAGLPVLVMTYLRGNPVVHGLDPVGLVEPLSRLHTAAAPPLPAFHDWFDPSRVRVPAWSSDRGAWRRLAELVTQPRPVTRHVFLHRDFHPGNLLWVDGALTGIVDWAYGCRGPQPADVAHTRCNLALVDGLAAAERFLEAYVRANPGYVHDPWWDAAELLPWDDDFSGVMAFNAFGAGLDLGRLRARADDLARLVCAQADGGA